MKKQMKILAVLLAVVLTLAMTACAGGNSSSQSEGSSSAADPDKVYKVGIVQYMEHNALDAATEGFMDALKERLGDKVEFDVQNAQGEQTNCTTIATKLVNDGVDLIMANATPAAQAASQATAEIPIIATSVTDFVEAGLVAANDAPGGNVSGSSDLSPIAEHIALMGTLCPDAQTIGVVYCSSEDNSIIQAEQAKVGFEEAGYTVTLYTAADSNELQPVLTKAVAEVDALYIPTDNLLAANMELVKNITIPEKIPVICGEENMAMSGGLATYSINYYTLGHAAGEMAYEVMVGGADISKMPVKFMDSSELTMVINTEVAEALEWEIPAELLEAAGLTASEESETPASDGESSAAA